MGDVFFDRQIMRPLAAGIRNGTNGSAFPKKLAVALAF
jgi:hypothetical protein